MTSIRSMQSDNFKASTNGWELPFPEIEKTGEAMILKIRDKLIESEKKPAPKKLTKKI